MNKTYVLVNSISLMVDKPREDFTVEDLVKVIEEKQIERITFHYTALDGKLKELKLPISNRSQVEQILADGERMDGSSLFKGLVDESLSDLYVIPHVTQITRAVKYAHSEVGNEESVRSKRCLSKNRKVVKPWN